MEKLAGITLMTTRRRALEDDWQRTFPAPDLAETRGDGVDWSLNRRQCPHPRERRAFLSMPGGRAVRVCTDCGEEVTR